MLSVSILKIRSQQLQNAYMKNQTMLFHAQQFKEGIGKGSFEYDEFQYKNARDEYAASLDIINRLVENRPKTIDSQMPNKSVMELAASICHPSNKYEI